MLHQERAAGLPDATAEFDELFELALKGCDADIYARAHALRDMVLKHARLTLAAVASRGEDPACCDPGGGMRSPHEIEGETGEDEPY